MFYLPFHLERDQTEVTLTVGFQGWGCPSGGEGVTLRAEMSEELPSELLGVVSGSGLQAATRRVRQG